jgi:ArpU family phage transcriptional regulator
MNWKNEAKEKLRRYDAMRLATINIPQEIHRLELESRRIRAARTDATPVSGGGNRREEALLNNLVHRQELANTLEQAKSWLKTTDRALSSLSTNDRLVLHRLYMYPEQGAVDRLCRELGLEQSTVYRRRDKALLLFTTAMYGTIDT